MSHSVLDRQHDSVSPLGNVTSWTTCLAIVSAAKAHATISSTLYCSAVSNQPQPVTRVSGSPETRVPVTNRALFW
jgi:hypothetical protein